MNSNTLVVISHLQKTEQHWKNLKMQCHLMLIFTLASSSGGQLFQDTRLIFNLDGHDKLFENSLFPKICP